MKKPVAVLSFFVGAPLLIVISLELISSLNPPDRFQYVATPTSPPEVLSAYTEDSQTSALSLPTLSANFTTADARPLIIKNYLERYKSPLSNYAQFIVDTSDKYALDYRILVAIAQQESNLCKRIPENSFNCWGFGIYGDKVTRFDNYMQGIETVAKVLKRDYIDKGLDTPEKIMAKYTPPSPGSWAQGVNQFLLDLE